MRLPILLAGLLAAVIGQAKEYTIAWDGSPSWPSGTTVEVTANGVFSPGNATNSVKLDLSVSSGQKLDIKARAIPPTGYQCGNPLALCSPSTYALLAATIPADPEAFTVNTKLITIPAKDDFNRVNENPLAGNWATVPGFSGLKIASKLLTTSGGDSVAYWKAATFTANQKAKCTVATLADGDFGPAVRISTGNLYWASPYQGSMNIFKFSGGVFRGSITTSYKSAVVVKIGDNIEISAVGNALKAYVNGTLAVDGTDSGLSSGAPGMFIYNSLVKISYWQADNL